MGSKEYDNNEKEISDATINDKKMY